MSAGRYDIKKMDRGANFGLTIHYKNPDGTAINLTGYTAKASIKESPDEVEQILDFTVDIPSPKSNGIVTLDLTPAQTLTLIELQYYYDVILINGDFVQRVIDGVIYISEHITDVTEEP